MADATSVTWEVCVDWDATDWAATPDYTTDGDDISTYVSKVNISRGKEVEDGNSPAATCEIEIKPGNCLLFSPENSSGTYYGKIRPWLPCRVRAVYDSTEYAMYAGFISRISINPRQDIQSVYIYLTDGMDLLARQVITQDYDNRTSMSDGAAIAAILDAAGWSSTNRDIDTDGGSDLLNYPQTGAY